MTKYEIVAATVAISGLPNQYAARVWVEEGGAGLPRVRARSWQHKLSELMQLQMAAHICMERDLGRRPKSMNDVRTLAK